MRSSNRALAARTPWRPPGVVCDSGEKSIFRESESGANGALVTWTPTDVDLSGIKAGEGELCLCVCLWE